MYLKFTNVIGPLIYWYIDLYIITNNDKLQELTSSIVTN